ncbi:MAG: FlgD immunoglobulin-like domain containing protein [Candidatus Krumholzibacteriia bacterium]
MARLQARLALLLCLFLATLTVHTAQAAPGDENWDTRFSLPGVIGNVTATAVYGGDLIVAGEFIAVGGQAIVNIARWDGTQWTAMGDLASGGVEALVEWNGALYAGGWFTGGIAAWDGTAWNTVGGGVDDTVEALAVWNSQLAVCGYFSDVDGNFAGNIALWDGSAWDTLDEGMDGEVAAVASYGGDLYACGTFELAGFAYAPNLARWDGGGWSGVGGGLSDEFGDIYNVYAETLAAYAGDLYIGGYFMQAGSLPVDGLVRWNGSSFDVPGSPPVAEETVALGFYGADLVATDVWGGIQRWNGAFWSTLGFCNGAVTGMTDWGGGLVVGGYFNTVESVPAAGLAVYDGSWAALVAGQGALGTVDVVGDWDGTPIAGGRFGKIGDVSGVVAAWDGSAWQPLGSGIAAGIGVNVQAVASFEGDLIVGGAFSTAGGVPANKIARWDGTQWSAMGAGSQSTVSGLLSLGGALYANGYWGGEQTLGRWNGSDFDPLGTGVQGGVQILYSLGSYQGDPVMGGQFTSVDGVSANNIARWDGSAWQPLGAGTSYTVNAIHEMNGLLYVGGGFLEAGGQPASRIAVWDGTNWSPLGDGVNNVVRDITSVGSDLYVTGDFTQAGGQPAAYVAVWDGSAWSALGSGLDARGNAAYALANDVWVGGEFQLAGTAGSARVGLWHPADTAVPPLEAGASTLTLRPAWPNPFAGSTSFGFSLSTPATVSVDVYDVRGAHVRRLDRGRLDAGPHRVSWDGRDAKGQRAPAGVYFVAVRDGQESAGQRVVLVR